MDTDDESANAPDNALNEDRLMRLLSEVNRRARNSGAGPSRGGRSGAAGGSGSSSARQPRIDLNTLRAAMARASNALGQPPPTVRPFTYLTRTYKP